jgi:hypothetical protein
LKIARRLRPGGLATLVRLLRAQIALFAIDPEFCDGRYSSVVVAVIRSAGKSIEFV